MTEPSVASMLDDPRRCDSRSGSCHICGDEAVVGRVTGIDEETRMATVAFPAGPAMVALDLVDAQVGDDLLVHLGFAIELVAAE